jgi:LmbE family N-acetylglucosaminyl deacetylase
MKILVLAPHADDEVLGAGGTIARAVAMGHQVVVAVMTGHGVNPHPLWPPSTWDTVRAECRIACRMLGVTQLIFRELPAACLNQSQTWEINRTVAQVIDEVAPDEVYVPFEHDLHLDHQTIAYAAMVALRPFLPGGRQVRRVLAYETLSETHLTAPYLAPTFEPNVFVDISPYIDKKIEAMKTYQSQIQPDYMPRSARALRALATLRGAHIGVDAAEAFFLLRETLS